MNGQRIAALLLIAGGALALGYGGFSYTRETHRADIGPMHLAVAETGHVDIPVWLGAGAIVIGGLVLVAGSWRPG